MSDTIRTASLTLRYKLGRQLLKASQKQGRGSLAEIAEEMGLTPSQAYALRVIAERFTREQFNEFLRIRRKDGLPLSVSYLDFAARIVDPEKRMALLEKAAEKNMSPRAFNELVVRANKGRK